MAGEKDDGQVDPALLHRLLEFEPAHAGHAHVEDEAAGRIHVGDEKVPRARIGDGAPALDFKHQRERVAHVGFVVDETDEGRLLFGASGVKVGHGFFLMGCVRGA